MEKSIEKIIRENCIYIEGEVNPKLIAELGKLIISQKKITSLQQENERLREALKEARKINLNATQVNLSLDDFLEGVLNKKEDNG